MRKTAFFMFILLCLCAGSAWADEQPKFKDFIFRGMKEYKIDSQDTKFERLVIKSAKPESKDVTETTYEGNRVYTLYRYTGAKEITPSALQILRYYQSGVQKLNGQILYDDGEKEIHASFMRNDKQYYMTVAMQNFTRGDAYIVQILEVTELKQDVELVDCNIVLTDATQKDYAFRGMPEYKIDEQNVKFERLVIKSTKPESKDVTETTYEGNRVYTLYRYTGAKELTPSALQILRYYKSGLQKLNGQILYDDGEKEIHASFMCNDKQYYMTVVMQNFTRGDAYIVEIIEVAELVQDVELTDCNIVLTDATQKDYAFRGLPEYKIDEQNVKFERLAIKSAKPESTETTETTYEGNRVYTLYRYTGAEKTIPSALQILRYYKSGVQKLNGQILYDDGEKEIHASFMCNDKQYYMTVAMQNFNRGGAYIVQILEVAELEQDVEIVDSDTILHKLNKEGHIALYINFDSGKATIKPESDELIDEVVLALKTEPALKVKLEGHTDNVGSAEANQKLSEDRANAVMQAIAAKGIDQGRLSAEGFGLTKPIADNNTEEGKAKNRRVELVRQ